MDLSKSVPVKRKVNDEDEPAEDKEVDVRKTALHIGISFWVIFDWQNYGLSAYENRVSKLFLESKVDLITCKALRGRKYV